MDARTPSGSQPVDRRLVNRSEPRSEPAYRPSDESARAPEPSYVPPSRSSRATGPSEPRRKKPTAWIIATIVFALLFVAASVYAFLPKTTGSVGIDADKYQVVYLLNGQLYFGKLSQISTSQYRLEKAYYLQTPATPAATDGAEAAEDSEAQLVKLSSAIYGPEDAMVISSDQVLYYQNLTPESRAAQLIESDR